MGEIDLNNSFMETFQSFINLQRENRKKDKNIVILCLCTLILQTFMVLSCILYFFNNYDISMETTTETTTQTVEGDNANINNIECDEFCNTSH